MRLRDENKRKLIVQTAVRLFSERPFNRVRLDDVAEAAGVGKGTVYIYFKNKEELYYSLVYESFVELVARLRGQLAQPMSHREKIMAIVDGLADHGIRHPQLFEIMRTVAIPDASSAWDATRREFCKVIEDAIREGIASGEFTDAHPERTGMYLMAMVRAVLLYGTPITDPKDLAGHISSILLGGITRKIS
ncbi:MAG TPA: TetR/AcrR family transcriptional regulator [Tepidisphaeraceae bacterium]|jgi:AcrR family transcriptional regulator|nr:TetR/AcrR family transcriptional regulator [Tepidisphaeraceae bacterium]